MRHRKVISLYDADPSHALILDYLESFEGRNRQMNALMQLLIVGHRVIANLESGEEAYYHARNPDVRRVKRTSPPKRPGVSAPRIERAGHSGRDSDEGLPISGNIVIEEGEVIHPLPEPKLKSMPAPVSTDVSMETSIPDLDDVVDPLMKLQMLSGD